MGVQAENSPVIGELIEELQLEDKRLLVRYQSSGRFVDFSSASPSQHLSQPPYHQPTSAQPSSLLWQPREHKNRYIVRNGKPELVPIPSPPFTLLCCLAQRPVSAEITGLGIALVLVSCISYLDSWPPICPLPPSSPPVPSRSSHPNCSPLQQR